MKNFERLKDAKTLSDLAAILGYKPAGLSFVLYKIPDASKYKEFKIPKKDGGERTINAPIDELKLIQSRLSDLLQECYLEISKTKTHGRSLSHGFRKHHSIVTNANNHKNRRYVFNVDLKDFFPSINFGRVRGYFIKSKEFELDPKIATIIAQIACHGDELPQGSPVSPVISNLIGHVLDTRLVRLAKTSGCHYSRYADDLTFSTRAQDFPDDIALLDAKGDWIPGPKLERVISRSGFQINDKKVSMQYRTSRQMATGLVVNRLVNVRQSYYRQARAMCDSLFRTGAFCLGAEMRWGVPKGSTPEVPGSIAQLRGVLSFIYYVSRQSDRRNQMEQWKKPTAKHNLFQRFFYFERFHALERPLVICEGKTDSVYLKCAIKTLSVRFPDLIDMSGSEKKWKVDFLAHSNLTLDLLQFSGGTGDFPKFISTYEKRMKPFLTSGRAHPVIILIDNDSGAGPTFSAAKDFVGSKVDGSSDFYHLKLNLYLVVLPKPSGVSELTIEDYFDPTIKSEVLEGKTFEPDTKKFNPARNYGKHVFADKIIKKKQTTINFDKFEPALKRLRLAIANYYSMTSST